MNACKLNDARSHWAKRFEDAWINLMECVASAMGEDNPRGWGYSWEDPEANHNIEMIIKQAQVLKECLEAKSSDPWYDKFDDHGHSEFFGF